MLNHDKQIDGQVQSIFHRDNFSVRTTYRGLIDFFSILTSNLVCNPDTPFYTFKRFRFLPIYNIRKRPHKPIIVFLTVPTEARSTTNASIKI